MKKYFLIHLLFLVSVLVNAQKVSRIDYPIAHENTVIDTFYSDYLVEDKYRWLENTRSDEVSKWVNEQNKISRRYLSRTSAKTNSFVSIDKYIYTRYENPKKSGDYYFSYFYPNDLSVPALYYKTELRFDFEMLIDPNHISQKDKIILKRYSLSKDSKLLAYQFGRNGSDWAELKVVSLKNGVHKDDHLKNLKFSNIVWKDMGFFYSTFPVTDQFGKTLGEKVLYHKIGTKQSEDKIIFKRNNPTIQFEYQTTTNERFFILKEINEQSGKVNVYYIDYESEQQALRPLLRNLTYDINFLDSHNGKLIATTAYKTNNGTIIEIDPANPLQWRAIAPEFSKALLLEAIPLKDRIIAVYQSNQHPIITIFAYDGEVLYNLELPVATSVGGFNGNHDDEELFFNFSSYTIPPVVYKFNIRTFERELVKQTKVAFDFKNIEYKEVDFMAKDSTEISMILVYKKGLELNGLNPTVLKAYGGFGAISLPSFDPGIVYFIEKGGVFAFANIRGGGDYGVEWAEQGRGLNKQTSMNDFISAAEFLIDSDYTNPDKLGITGGSNGGLVVAVAAIQRPDLFKVAVPVVAPLDMIRFERFTIGHFHTDEYGTVRDSLSFTKLLNYSPYHNIKENINYPAMLIMTSENDDRVPPFHSYKFAARLQNREAQTNPIILRVEKKAGHYGASTLMTTIQETADMYGFMIRIINE